MDRKKANMGKGRSKGKWIENNEMDWKLQKRGCTDESQREKKKKE